MELHVSRPVNEVFDYFLDFRNENEWNVVARDVKILTTGPIGVGSRFRGQYQGMGTLEYEILEYDRPRRACVRGTSNPFDFVSTFELAPKPAGTNMTGTMDPRPKGFVRLVAPVIGAWARYPKEGRP